VNKDVYINNNFLNNLTYKQIHTNRHQT